MARNYAALPHEYLEEMEALSDAEFGRLCRALLKYSMTGEEEQLNGAERILLKRVFLQERRFQTSYEEMINARREAGKKGASKRWQAMANDSKAMANDSKNGYTETKTKTKILPSNDGKDKNARARFVPPSLDDVKEFAFESGISMDAQAFWDYYASNGWKVGSNPMKDWKAAARNWAKRSFGRAEREKPPVGSAGSAPLGDLEQEAVRRILQGR